MLVAVSNIMTMRCPNTFTHPDWIRAISAHLPGGEMLRVPGQGMARLSTVIQAKSWPIPHVDTWVTPLSPTGIPISARQPEPTDVLALIDATESPMLFRDLPVDHPTTDMLLQSATHTKIINRWKRAALHLEGTYENWLQTNFDQKRRKELKRLRARLSEQGTLESIELPPDGNLAPFTAAFLKLEVESWKGKRGTAIGNSPQATKALEAGLEAMHRAGRLKFWQINFNGEAIASLFALTDDGEATLGKIAHSNAYAKYSPGVLIILDATAALFADPTIVRADSNAIPDHPMIDRIWRDRIECVDALLAGPSTPTAVFQILSLWLGTKAALRPVIKRHLARLTGRKIS
jgi:CelD/BcsL family acetyltransferase involved in cellulose biosynthesis